MELRPGYKQTEVGVIPDDWETAPFDHVFTRVNAKRHQLNSGFYQDVGAFPVVDQGQKPIVGYTDRTDLRFNISGDGVVVFGDHTCIVKFVNFDFVVGADGTQVLAEKDGHSARFHAYELERSGIPSTGYNRHFKFLKERQFASPVLPEQSAIATALGDVDALLAAQDALIAKKRAIKQGAMQELLTGKRRLPGFSGEWEVKALREIGVFLKGRGVRKDEANSGELCCVRYGEIYTQHDFYIIEFNSSISKEVAATATRIVKGDLLFAGSGETKEEIGKCIAFQDEMEAYAGGDIVILRPKLTHPIFMGYACNQPAVQKQKAGKGQGDAVVHIGASALASIEIPLPSVEEQTAIAEVLSDMDSEITALENRRVKTAQLKQGMMQALLTGRIRLV